MYVVILNEGKDPLLPLSLRLFLPLFCHSRQGICCFSHLSHRPLLRPTMSSSFLRARLPPQKDASSPVCVVSRNDSQPIQAPQNSRQPRPQTKAARGPIPRAASVLSEPLTCPSASGQGETAVQGGIAVQDETAARDATAVRDETSAQSWCAGSMQASTPSPVAKR